MKSVPTVREWQGAMAEIPAGSFRSELGNAAVGAIRQRGSEAFGVFFIGIAYVLVALLALFLFLLTYRLFGVDFAPVPVTMVSVLSSAVGWAAGRTVWGRLLDSRHAGITDCPAAEKDLGSASSVLTGSRGG